jgi:hypothetical protein
VVAREASGGEQGGARTREGGRQVGGKKTKKKGGAPVEAKSAVNDIRLSLAGVVEAWLSFAGWMTTVLVVVEVRTRRFPGLWSAGLSRALGYGRESRCRPGCGA